jgi:hypothetical protein
MKTSPNTAVGAVSGCIIWVILLSVIGACLVPIAGLIGGFTNASSLAVRVTGAFECPKGTTPEIYSYQTTSTDDNGFPTPATAYELHCLGARGEIVKNDPVFYAFLWEGIFMVLGLITTVILALIVAAPAGAIITRLLNGMKARPAAG